MQRTALFFSTPSIPKVGAFRFFRSASCPMWVRQTGNLRSGTKVLEGNHRANKESCPGNNTGKSLIARKNRCERIGHEKQDASLFSGKKEHRPPIMLSPVQIIDSIDHERIC
jgi:hypothetical protein